MHGSDLCFDRNSPIIVLSFSGCLSVDSIENMPAPLQELDVHFVAPTVPDNAESSAIVCVLYAGLCNDSCALLNDLHPDGTDKV